MPWWGWLALGVALLVAELSVSADFWLAVVGAAALVPAALGFLGFDLPIWSQWLSFGVFSVVLAVFARGPLSRRLMEGTKALPPELVGEEVRALEAIAPGAMGKVSLRGSTWNARNEGATAVAEGGVAHVAAVDGVQLSVRPVASDPA